ncbi:MAG: hypothetical protein NTU87_00880 [Verrucomicrobia bacterium]|nr:hypothetical protein [Verrucomicrobiota bacterium]
MKNKILLSIVAALGLASVNNGNSQGYGPVTFIDVATSGEYVTVATGTGGSVNVDATILTKSQRWTKDKVYLLERNVIVPTGVTLTIEPGTLLRGARPSKGQGASGAEAALSPADPGALVVARGGRIIAAGTADAAIIFTSMDDPNVPGGAATIPPYENYGVAAGTGIINSVRTLKTGFTTVSGTAGVGEFIISGGTLTAYAQAYGDDLTQSSSKWSVDGEFGGIVLAGYAETVVGVANGSSALTTAINNGTINVSNGAASGTSGVQLIEGMAAFPTYGLGGGDNESDDSGILRFIDLRYGGYIIAASKELNSYSFYGIGRNTVAEFLADWNNADDSFELWGGSLNLRHCISAFPGDDGLDTDQGYTGTVQFYVQLQNNAVDANGNLSRRALVNVGDSQSENDGPESGNSAVPYTVFTLANATFIGRGYNTIAERYNGGTGVAATSTIEPATGPNYKDNGSTKVYNSLFMDSPHGAMMVMDRAAVGATTSGTGGNSAINRFTQNRTSGGFDAAGRASDLVTAQTTAPGEKDGLFNNVWFFRDGLLDTGAAGVNGKYGSLAALNSAVTANPGTYYVATDDTNLFPDRTDRTERGALTNGTAVRANIADMIAVIKASNGVKFDTDPGVSVPLNHRLSGIDIKPSNSAARDLASSQLPNYDTAGTTRTTRSLVTGAAFVGAVRDSSWFRGWNFASQSGCFANSAVAIVPTVTVGKTAGGNPQINFGAETGVKYSLEVSTDNKSFVPVTVLEGANLPYTDASKTVGTTALYYRAIAL